MHEQIAGLFQVLTKAGAVPGKDFSVDPDDGGIRMNERGYQILKRQYPEIDWDDVTSMIERDPDEAVQAVHQHLGLNFVDRLLTLVRQRLVELSQEHAAWYLQQIVFGVQQRTGISLYERLTQGMNPSQQLRLECLLRADLAIAPCCEWIEDLVIAAGGNEQDVMIENEEALLSEFGMRLLASVWAGEHDLYAEIARICH